MIANYANCETSLSNSFETNIKILSRKCIDEKDLWDIVRWCGEGEREKLLLTRLSSNVADRPLA